MEQIDNLNNLSPISQKRRWYRHWWGIIIILIILYLLASFVIVAFLSDSSKINSVGSLDGKKVKEADLYFNSQDDPFIGNRNSPVRIVEFSDFQCPFCKQSFFVVREILDKYKDDIFFTYRDFPVTQIHPESLKAAEAAQCANEQGKFWSMHDKIFINQENITITDLKIYALEIGLDSSMFNNCLDSGKYNQEVIQDYSDGLRLGVVGTPTFFINGYRISGSIPKDIFNFV